jgi:hypothetical protein
MMVQNKHAAGGLNFHLLQICSTSDRLLQADLPLSDLDLQFACQAGRAASMIRPLCPTAAGSPRFAMPASTTQHCRAQSCKAVVSLPC